MKAWTTRFALVLTIGCGSAEEKATTDSGTPSTPTTTTATTSTSVTTTSTDAATDAGCVTPGPAVDQETLSFMVGDMERFYRINAPALDEGIAVPLLLAFHGGDGRNERFPQQRQFNDIATSGDAIVVYPMSELVAPNEGEWRLNTTEEMHHDIDYVEALIERVAAAYCIDRDRIYATGYSLGSMFTYELPCHLPQTFAAIASYAGSMPIDMYTCDTSSSMGILHIHGQRDDLIDYDEPWDWKEWDSVGTMWDIPGMIDFWKDTYACTEDSVTETGEAERIVHTGCAGNVRVEHIGVKRTGHEWPQTIDDELTSSILWDFLTDHNKATGQE